jgi:dihydrofolate reductase
MRVSLVVAAAENGTIGTANRLPWHLPDDLKHFKALTLGKPILMGRKTFASIGKPLPGRVNIVMSRQRDLELPGCHVVDSMRAARQVAGDARELCVIGGGELYAQALSSTHVIHLTRVHATIAGDAFFPTLDPSEWQERVIGTHEADERHAYAFSFIELERVSPPLA